MKSQQRGERARVNTTFLSNVLLEQEESSFSNHLPETEDSYVAPTLAKCAHSVWHDPTTQAFLYVGPKRAAGKAAYDSLVEANVLGIVNCTTRLPCHFRNEIRYCQVPVNDEAGADILTYLTPASLFIHAHLSAGSSVLIHCEMGISRSATAAIAYLMRFQNMSREEAYIHVKQNRPPVRPNPGFWEQLRLYQDHVLRNEDEEEGCDDENANTKRPIDASWAKESSALFGAFRETEVLKDTMMKGCFSRLQGIDVDCASQVLLVCLDFVWGRGVLQVDVDWLAKVCSILDQADSEPGSTTIVKSLVMNSDSDFRRAWTGEVFKPQVDRVFHALEIDDE